MLVPPLQQRRLVMVVAEGSTGCHRPRVVTRVEADQQVKVTLSMARSTAGTRKLTDDELIAGLKRHDRQAEREFYERYGRILRLRLLRQTGCPNLADEWAHETLVRAFGCIHDFRGDAPLGTWISGIAYHTVMGGFRALRRDERRLASLHAVGPVSTPCIMRDPFRTAQLWNATRRLSPLQRQVLLLRAQDMTHREIGAILGVAAGTSKATLHKLRIAMAGEALLRESLTE